MTSVDDKILTCYPLGMYKGGSFIFSVNINTNYPHEPPKVKCTQTVSHVLSCFVDLNEMYVL